MKTIIAGSRHFTEPTGKRGILLAWAELERVWPEFKATEICCGMADGIDTYGAEFAHWKGIPIIPFPADWDNLNAPGAVIKKNKRGKLYNVRAGHDRNQRMADYADVLLAIWDGRSTGTEDMMRRAGAAGLRVFMIMPTKGATSWGFKELTDEGTLRKWHMRHMPTGAIT